MSQIFVLLVIVPLAFPAEGISNGGDFTVSNKDLTVSNGGTWGDWGTMVMCPKDYRAFGFSLKVEESQGIGDDTALNGIRLICRHVDNFDDQTTITSSTAEWGTWTKSLDCGSKGYLKSFSLRVEHPLVETDDTAANNIKFRCTNSGVGELTGYGMTWGSWSMTYSSNCAKGICGLQTRVEAPQGWDDDTALNDVRFRCCE
ncbi:vitelline membrane outer layer protein 1-like [Engraulis encrasicolus]|uniref:vitelline membrane outer layer protein 1-like n=1 Tax=Engraulis encrasicolus TaxID=184585 RepID=UPI002FD35EF8